MTDNDMIKALECKAIGVIDCMSCPYFARYPECDRYAVRDALRLIHRQQAEIERLQNEIRLLHANDMTIAEKVKEQAKGYERGVKEFAERLKPMYKVLCVDEGDWCNELDNLVKEMVGEDK